MHFQKLEQGICRGDSSKQTAVAGDAEDRKRTMNVTGGSIVATDRGNGIGTSGSELSFT